jgi:hypothetical protein
LSNRNPLQSASGRCRTRTRGPDPTADAIIFVTISSHRSYKTDWGPFGLGVIVRNGNVHFTGEITNKRSPQAAIVAAVHKANSIGSGHASTSPDYFHDVAESVADAGAVPITGPANAKTELVEYIHLHHPRLTKVITGVETVDHPSDAQLVAHARKYLMATDRMRP